MSMATGMSYNKTPSNLVRLDNGDTYLPVKPTSPVHCTECCARNDALLCAKLIKAHDCNSHDFSDNKVVFVPYKIGSKATDTPKHQHYFKDVSKLDKLDVYRIIDLYEISDPCIQHALKKILVAGGRGHKDIKKDIQDVIDTLERWKEMQDELST